VYWCYNCETEFEEPVKLPVGRGEYWGAAFIEYGDCCPHCKSGDIAYVMYKCDCCKSCICELETYFETDDGQKFCENCITKKEA